VGGVVKVFVVDFSAHRSRYRCEKEEEELKKEELTEQTRPDKTPVREDDT
jgi:hypothetical protein